MWGIILNFSSDALFDFIGFKLLSGQRVATETQQDKGEVTREMVSLIQVS